MGAVLTRAYRKGVLEAEGFEMEAASDHLEDADTFVWVDLSAPASHQLQLLAEELDLHELAVEDALRPHQRPKLDHYGSHVFLSCRAVEVNVERGDLVETQINAFVHPRWIVTVRESDAFSVEPVVARCDRSADLAAHGPAFVLWALMDVVVDDYFDAVEAFDDYYDAVAERIFGYEPLDPDRQRHWFEMRRIMVRFHRLVGPTREAVSAVMRREHGLLSDELNPYYQDVYDHILRVSESSDSLRDLVATIVETNLSLRDFRQNQIVKKVGSWAAIITVASVITGYYGMNVPFPGSGSVWGVIASTGLILVASVLLYVMFRRRDWL